MKTYSLTHLSDETLLRDAAGVHAQERSNTALGLAHIAEIDHRKLYRQAGHPSIHSYCVHELRLSPQAAFKRIHAARAARRFPTIFVALAEGRLHLSTVVTIAASLTEDTVEELIQAAENKTKCEVERLLAGRKLGVEPSEEIVFRSNVGQELSLGKVEQPSEPGVPTTERNVACEVAAPEPLLTIQQRYPLHLTMSQEMLDDLRRARNLLGHQLPSGDVAAVLHRGLKALIRELEKRKCAATDRPRAKLPPGSCNGRHIPAAVRRAVWERDRGRCTFVGSNGKRCPARKMLEFDHVVEVARGGRSTESNLRLLCKAHNQYRAEQTFGSGFMEDRRQESRAARVKAASREDTEQVMGCMRRLGFTADESRRAAAHAAGMPGASLEARVRAALSYLVPPRGGRSASQSTTAADSRPAGKGVAAARPCGAS